MAPVTDDLGVYWENGEPSIIFERRKGVRTGASITVLPSPNSPPGTNRLRYADLALATNAVTLFGRLDDILHTSGAIRENRHTILLKLLLVKLYDEERAQENHGVYMLVQDFSSVDKAWDNVVERIFTTALDNALARYNGVIAKTAPRDFGCSGAVLREISAVLCKIRLLGALPQVIQDLFM
jgi:hypothetical protein